MTNPTFSIIMRTCGRPIMLHRALQSVSNQTYKNYELILVNDNGDSNELFKVLDNFKDKFFIKTPEGTGITGGAPNLSVLFINSNRHMEKTSNEGLKVAKGDFVCIHDDDDSWKPNFLEEVHNEIAKSKDPYPVIMTHFDKIYEIMDIENDSIREVCRNNTINWLQCLQLGFILAGNIFPPISLVYKREILSHIGMYDENLPVMGDWDFLIRLSYFTHIKILKKPLANYHIRVTPSGIYGNSVNTEGWSNLHIEYEGYVRHKYQYTRVLLPNFETRDIGSDIVNAKASKTFWHWDYVKEVENILQMKPNYKNNMEHIIEKIKEKYPDRQPRIYMYGAGTLFHELMEDGTIQLLKDKFLIEGVIDKKYNNYNLHEFPISVLDSPIADIDVIIVTLKYPPDAVSVFKNAHRKDIDVFCIASDYE